jgi:hypothetical protein
MCFHCLHTTLNFSSDKSNIVKPIILSEKSLFYNSFSNLVKQGGYVRQESSVYGLYGTPESIFLDMASTGYLLL